MFSFIIFSTLFITASDFIILKFIEDSNTFISFLYMVVSLIIIFLSFIFIDLIFLCDIPEINIELGLK